MQISTQPCFFSPTKFLKKKKNVNQKHLSLTLADNLQLKANASLEFAYVIAFAIKLLNFKTVTFM